MIGSIPYNPVFFSYAVVTQTNATLYVDESKLSDDVKAHLGKDVQLERYEAIFDDLEVMRNFIVHSDEGKSTKPMKYLISTKASWALKESLGGEDNVEEVRSPIGDAKAIKNETELAGMRACHIRDGAALTEYFAWLEEQLVTKGVKLDEVEAADKLEALRA